ncbi:class II aldolase/adducin family protein [Spirillospora sp. NBC_00431]
MKRDAPAADPREEVARVARAVVRAGLAGAFGHVSARRDDGGFVITSTRPLGAASAGDLIEVSVDGDVAGERTTDVPLELALHRAIYDARPDVGGICRGHPMSVVRWGAGLTPVPLRHGLGLIAGHVVPVYADVTLVEDAPAAAAAAAALGSHQSMILRGNGGLAVGASALDAATRLYFLEERALLALDPPPAARVGEAAWAARSAATDRELRRAARWFAAAHGGPIPYAPGPESGE